MTAERFGISTNLNVSIQYIGTEKTPIVIIDDFSVYPEALIESAATETNFNKARGDKNFYPGSLGYADKVYTQNMYSALKPIIREVYRQPVAYPDWVESTYAMVTNPPNELVRIQRIPHYDSTGPHQLAVLHYLCHPPHRGTAFYRHKKTGFETIQKAREDQYWSLVTPLLENEEFDSNYVDKSDGEYEKIGEVELKFNRLAIYPSQILHSSLIEPDLLSRDIFKGRLTLRTFIAY